MDDVNLPFTLNQARGNNDPLFVGPHTRIATNKRAVIETEALAIQFRDMLIPIYEKRYGDNVELNIHKQQYRTPGFSQNPDKKMLSKIKNDTTIVKKRIQSGNYSPNKAVT